MTFFEAFSPYLWLLVFGIWGIIGGLFLFITVYDYVEHQEKPSAKALSVYLLLLAGLFGLGVYGFSDSYLRADPTPGWDKTVQQSKVAVILGFGYGIDKKKQNTPERANIFLLQWTLDHTGADIILAQEGVMDAADFVKTSRSVTIYSIHKHDPKKYVNTMETAYCALSTLQHLNLTGRPQVVLIAHDLQLKRSEWDFTRIQQRNPEWENIELIIPKIPDTPYPAHPAPGQWHTGGQFRYKLGELFWARPRDYVTGVPTALRAPLDLHHTITLNIDGLK
jgi:hypothetical protein